jgi:hypothetical protein
MKNAGEIRKAGDWEIIHALHIGDKEVVFGENTTNLCTERYMCAYCRSDDLFQEYSECKGGDDYLEIMQIYAERIKGQVEAVKAEIVRVTVPTTPITASECYSNDLSKSIDGLIVAIRTDVLRREYRTAQHQLILVDGGFGANANSRGSAVFGYNLYFGEHSRYERRDVLGEVKPEHIPTWAHEKAAQLKERQKVKKRQEPER